MAVFVDFGAVSGYIAPVGGAVVFRAVMNAAMNPEGAIPVESAGGHGFRTNVFPGGVP
jgi:hypothetical protein